jgi:hypothetical protein
MASCSASLTRGRATPPRLSNPSASDPTQREASRRRRRSSVRMACLRAQAYPEWNSPERSAKWARPPPATFGSGRAEPLTTAIWLPAGRAAFGISRSRRVSLRGQSAVSANPANNRRQSRTSRIGARKVPSRSGARCRQRSRLLSRVERNQHADAAYGFIAKRRRHGVHKGLAHSSGTATSHISLARAT